MRMPIALASMALAGLASAAAGQDPRPMSAIEFVELSRVDEPSLSPDGKTLAFLRTETDWKNNEIVELLHLLDLESGEVTLPIAPEVQAGEDEQRSSHSRAIWSPDSSRFLVLLEREDDSERQAYLVTLGTGAIERLTDLSEEVEDVLWARDGSGFYFLSKREFGEEESKLRKRNFVIREYETRRPPVLWRYDLDRRAIEPVVWGDFHIREYSLARDGDAILELRAPGGLGDDIHDGELWLTDLVSKETRQLTSNDYAERGARLSPRKDMIAFIATVSADGKEYFEDNLFVQDVGALTPRLLFPVEQLEVLDFAWDSTGDGLYLIGNSGLRDQLYRYDLQTETLQKLTDGDHSISDWNYDHRSDRHLAVLSDASSPGEVFRFDPDIGGTLQGLQLTTQHSQLASRFALPRQEAFRWRGRKRQEIEGLLVYPVDHAEGRRFPLVTITHGGPRSSSQFGSWNNSRFVAVLAGAGYGVFLPNHRGGTGYGDDFMRDMVGGYFTNAHHDVMDGIDALIDRGLADPERLVKMGWSAGGHMTNKLITETDRFKAASSGAGASDWLSMYGESDIRHGRTPWFGGAPWSRRAPVKSFRKQSVVQKAWRVTTPTVFHVGGNDVRVPPTQSILLYRGIKAAGVPTELYIAKGEPHNYRKPSHQLFKIQTDLAWFAEHLGSAPYLAQFPEEALRAEEEEEPEAEPLEPEALSEQAE